MTDYNYKEIKAILRDFVDAVDSFDRNERDSWTNLLAVRDRALQHLDNKPGRNDWGRENERDSAASTDS